MVAGLAPSGRTEGIKLGVQVLRRFDEAASVIAHRLIARVRILGEDGDAGGDEHDDEDGQRKDGVADEEDDAEDTGDNALCRISISTVREG